MIPTAGLKPNAVFASIFFVSVKCVEPDWILQSTPCPLPFLNLVWRPQIKH